MAVQSSRAQVRSAMPGQRDQLGALAAAERVAVAPDEQRGVVRRAATPTARSSGPVVPSATRGDAAVPATSARAPTRRGATSPADASTAPSTSSALQSARNSCAGLLDEELVQRLDAARPRTASSPTRARRGAGRGSGRSCAPPRRSRRRPPRSRGRAGRARSIVAQHDRELVDRDVVAALEHVDADDVAVDRTDARGDEPERTGTVGEPDPHEDVRGRLGGVAHGHRWLRGMMTRMFRRGEDGRRARP